MVVVRYFRALCIILLSLLSATVVLLFAWLPNGGVYPFVSHRIFGPGLLKITGSTVQGFGLENLKIAKNKTIFVSNHQSHFDIPSIMTALPLPFYFISKKELKHIPIFGWGMWAVGMVFVDRSSREKSIRSMKLAAKSIEKGKNVLSFPEGTRSKDGQLQKFKKGAFHMAKTGNLNIIPLVVKNSRDILPPGGKLGKGKVSVTVLEPISSQMVAEMSVQELLDETRSRIEKVYLS
jgi:1-acyl-sn-glycerol-3-phosphate acyltransferase